MSKAICLINGDDKSAVEALVARIEGLGSDDFIALDTEFDRVKTLLPILALVQLEIDGICYLIDPLSFEIKPIIRALCETRSRILMFSCIEDLEVIVNEARRCELQNKLPRDLIDLQLMSAFANIGFQRGLQATLSSDLKVLLEKTETRSDWLSRPLSTEQIGYAADDVFYLKALFEKTLSFFKPDDERLGWFYTAMNDLRSSVVKDIEPQDLYLSVSGAGSLPLDALARLKFLCEKRYSYAFEHNIALNRVITGKALLPLALHTPLTLQGLLSNKMHPVAVRQHGKLVIGWIRQSLSIDKDPSLKRAYDSYAPGRSDKNQGQILKHHLKIKAQEHNIDADLLCTRKIVNDFFYHRASGGEAMLQSSWMKDCVGDLSRLFK